MQKFVYTRRNINKEYSKPENTFEYQANIRVYQIFGDSSQPYYPVGCSRHQLHTCGLLSLHRCGTSIRRLDTVPNHVVSVLVVLSLC